MSDQITEMIYGVIRRNEKVFEEFQSEGESIFSRYASDFYFPSDAVLIRDSSEALADYMKTWFWENAPVEEEGCEWWETPFAHVLKEISLSVDWNWIASEIIEGVCVGRSEA